MPLYTGEIDGLGTTRILETIRKSKYKDKIKFYQASTSELYGLVQAIPQKKLLHFIQDPHMLVLNYILIGLQKITEKHIIYIQ